MKIMCCAFLFACAMTINAQHRNNFEAGCYNVGFGGVISGIGVVINKKENEKTGKQFLKGFSQGALGGYLLFESKRLVGKFATTGNYNYVWPSKLVNSAGLSIIENAAANQEFLSTWHINVGFNRLQINTKDALKLSYRIMPFALANTVYGFANGHLEVSESLKTGSFVFSTKYVILNDVGLQGIALSNSMLYKSRNTLFDKKEIIAHELIHVYQYESFSGLNPFLNKPLNTLKNSKKWYRNYDAIFYTDFNYITDGGIYLLQKYENSFFEKEAGFYTFQIN